MTNILISVTIFVIAAFFGPADSYFESCISERCSTMPWSNETKNFNDAKNWCKERNSSLAVINDGSTQEALTEFLNSAQLNEQSKPLMFIDLQLQKNDKRTWYLVSGNKYLDTRCSNNSPNNYLYKRRCFVKFENQNLTWHKARESYHNNGGDLATFNYPAGTQNWPTEIQFNRPTSWLNQSLSYRLQLKYRAILTTTTIRISSLSKLRTYYTVSLPFADVTSSPRTSAVNNALIVGLVLGIAVILPLLIIILILVIRPIILHQKRSRERTQNNDRSATQLEAVGAAPDANYQHLNRQTMFGPGSEMPHYDQLNPTENQDYELTQ